MRARIMLGVALAFLGFGLTGLMGRAQTPGNLAALAVCNTEPETTAVINNTSSPVTIVSLSSIKDPQPYEPIAVNQDLAPGASVVFYLGPTAPAPALSPLRIYDNTATDEGAVIVTSIGTLTALCGSGSSSLAGLGSTVGVNPQPAPTVQAAMPAVITPPDTGDGGIR